MTKTPAEVKPRGRKNKRAPQVSRTRQKAHRPITRAEALLMMLENNGCPPEQLTTLRNTV